MPIFFQQQINDTTRLGIWKIEEAEAFFKSNVPQHRDVTHPHKRLQHLAGRFLLQYLFPAFPYELIQIADTRKPFLPDEQYHFSISHCGDYAAAIASRNKRVGIDIELPAEKILRIRDKFLSEEEKKMFNASTIPHPASGIQHPASGLPTIDYRLAPPASSIQHPGSGLLSPDYRLSTLLWSAKEAVFKWYGEGGVDFSENISLKKIDQSNNTIDCFFSKNETELMIHYIPFDHLMLAWVMS